MTDSSPDRQRNRANGRIAARSGWWLALLLAPGIASATLGQDAATVEQDRVQFRAQRSLIHAGTYSVHELRLPGGTRVREYLNAAQQIFAVAWNGPSIPDLQQLLGTYYPRYLGAAKVMGRARRRPIVMQEADLVIHTGGHPRAFFGVAYLPQSMPAGVSADLIK